MVSRVAEGMAVYLGAMSIVGRIMGDREQMVVAGLMSAAYWVIGCWLKDREE